MKWTIGKTYTFDSAHSLPHLPEDHKCHHLHGHTYSVQIVLSSEELGDDHFVLDYGDLKGFEGYVMALDHKNLNDIFLFPTTVEHLAKHLFEFASQLYKERVDYVEVREGFKTFGRYGR